MRTQTVTTNIYTFDELTEQAKEQALEKLYDINIHEDWYESVYYDAGEIGLKITEFDIDHRTIKGDLLKSGSKTADAIISNHGNKCDTYTIAESFRKDYDKLVSDHSDGEDLERVSEDNEYEFDKLADELENQFRYDLLECYLIILRKEYEYLTSKDAIVECIHANNYEFNEEGDLI